MTDEEVVRRELKLRDDLRSDPEFQVKPKASIEVAQVRFQNCFTSFFIYKFSVCFLLI